MTEEQRLVFEPDDDNPEDVDVIRQGTSQFLGWIEDSRWEQLVDASLTLAELRQIADYIEKGGET